MVTYDVIAHYIPKYVTKHDIYIRKASRTRTIAKASVIVTKNKKMGSVVII